MSPVERHLFSVLLMSVTAACQLPSSRCDEFPGVFADCPFTTEESKRGFPLASGVENSRRGIASSRLTAEASADDAAEAFISSPQGMGKENFHWGRALLESFTFLAIEQAYVVHDDYRWVVGENGVPLNHYWVDYKQSLSSWVHAGWDDGDPLLYSYVGHPIQGALTGYIQIQNDPRGRNLEFSNTKAYWWSRFKALMWNAAYSTQWNIGPLSELTVEKYGAQARPPWNQDGSWPCTHKPCVTGVGQVDLVMTPVGGFGWLLTEDLLDKEVARRVEGATRNHFLIDFTRCALNPVRGGANMLHGKAPWYRASRDVRQVYFAKHLLSQSADNTSNEK